MNIAEIIKESTDKLVLKDLCEIRTNFPGADFWIQRKGSEDTVGTVVSEFSPENIGVKVISTDRLDPRYLKYVVMHLKNRGYFKNVASGTLKLKNISADSVARIPIGNA